MKMEGEMKFVAGGGLVEELAAIYTGAMDGRFASFITMAPLAVQGKVREVLSISDYLPKEWSHQTIVAEKEFAQARPEVVKRVAKAVIKSMDFVVKNEAWALERMKSPLGYTDETARAVYKRLRYSPDGKIDLKALENVRGFLLEYGIISKDKAPPVDQLYLKEMSG